MSVKQKLKMRLNTYKQVDYVNKICGNKKLTGFYEGEIIRNVHSIEKGLSLEKPRQFFGIPKMIEMLDLVMEYTGIEGYSTDIVNMALDAVDAYKEYHRTVLDNPKLARVIKKHDDLRKKYPKMQKSYAGILKIERKENENKFDELSSIINERHSVRDFSKAPVPMELLHNACQLALRAPSACNRQGTRLYILTGKNKNLLADWLSGVGGFAEEVDKYIIITAKVSVYRFEEACQFQYVVSAAILAGYLSLSLQSLGIGACLIQRPLVRTGSWIDLSEKLGIAEDEQIVLMIGVGMLKKEYNVPISNRLDYKTIVKEL